MAHPIEKQTHALDHGSPGADQDGTLGILSTKAPELGGWALLPTLRPPITMGLLTPLDYALAPRLLKVLEQFLRRL